MKRPTKFALRYPIQTEFERMNHSLVSSGGKLLKDKAKLHRGLYSAVETALGYDIQANLNQYDHCSYMVNFLYQHFICEEISAESIALLHTNTLPPDTKGVFVYDGERKQQSISCGIYRKIDTYIIDTKGEEIDFLPHEQIGEALDDAVSKYNNSLRKIDDIVRLFLSYNAIHPFMDGNGKTGRLLLESLLLANGYYPALMKKSYVKYMPIIAKIMNDYTFFPKKREVAVEKFIQFLLYRCYKIVYF